MVVCLVLFYLAVTVEDYFATKNSKKIATVPLLFLNSELLLLGDLKAMLLLFKQTVFEHYEFFFCLCHFNMAF